jgi:PEP-CTERM motif
MKKFLSAAIFTALVLSCPREAKASIAFSLPSTSDFRNSSWSFGEIFTVGASNISVTALGAYDAGLDGFISVGGIPVGIFRESDDALLASGFVNSGDTLIDNFRYVAISPLVLLSGVSYRVVAVNLSDLYNVAFGQIVDPAITRTGYGYCNTTALTSCDNFTGSERVWMANFQFGPSAAVPEPLTLTLTGVGLAGIAILRRRRAGKDVRG